LYFYFFQNIVTFLLRVIFKRKQDVQLLLW